MPEPHVVRAHNPATASENRIHADDVARQYGFRGGLVPGVTTWAYLTHPVVAEWGRDWLAGGTMRVRFGAPVYDGEALICTARPDGAGDGGRALVATGPDGVERATGRAGLLGGSRDREEWTPDPHRWPVAPLPQPGDRQPATPEVLGAMDTLGTMEAGFHAAAAVPWLDMIDDHLPIYREAGVAHPGWLIQWANWILAANVRLGPWIHVETDATHLAPITDGVRFEVRGRVAEVFETRGHHFAVLDLLWVAGGRAALHARHTAIYLLRAPNGRNPS